MHVEMGSSKIGHIEINIPTKFKDTKNTTTKEPKNNVEIKGKWFKNMWKFYVDDINRMIFPFKVGLAVFLVSLLVLIPATYQFFGGNNLIWAILTTAIMFEYTVGKSYYLFTAVLVCDRLIIKQTHTISLFL